MIFITHQGYELQLDDEDYTRVAEHKWWRTNKGHFNSWINNQPITLGRFILNYDGPLVVCHLDGDTKKNTKLNLAVKTVFENAQQLRTNKTGYPGVSFHRMTGKYQVFSSLNGKQVYIGLFKTPEEANTQRINWLKKHNLPYQ